VRVSVCMCVCVSVCVCAMQAWLKAQAAEESKMWEDLQNPEAKSSMCTDPCVSLSCLCTRVCVRIFAHVCFCACVRLWCQLCVLVCVCAFACACVCVCVCDTLSRICMSSFIKQQYSASIWVRYALSHTVMFLSEIDPHSHSQSVLTHERKWVTHTHIAEEQTQVTESLACTTRTHEHSLNPNTHLQHTHTRTESESLSARATRRTEKRAADCGCALIHQNTHHQSISVCVRADQKLQPDDAYRIACEPNHSFRKNNN